MGVPCRYRQQVQANVRWRIAVGAQNLKFETEVFQIPPGGFNFPGTTPVETKPDPSWITQIASQISQLNFVVGQIHQAVLGQAFTRAAPQGGTDTANLAEEVRRLSSRIDEIEARTSRG
jgi:hypothetical protein